MNLDQKTLSCVQRWVSDHMQEMIEDLSELVKIRSVSEPNDHYSMGEGCARCADKAMEIGSKWGFYPENHDYYCVSLLMKGDSPTELGILGHLDVVPEGTGWSFDPYSGAVQDGYLIGRGAGDNKGACVMALYAMRCIRELHLPFSSNVRLILGFNEEGGMKDVEHYLQVKRPPRFTIVCDGAWPMIIGEKGILTADLTTQISSGNLLKLQGGITSNSVPDRAWAVVQTDRPAGNLRQAPNIQIFETEEGLRIQSTGKACHAMAPEGGINAIHVLAEYLLTENLLEGDARRAVCFVKQVTDSCYGEGLGIQWEDSLSGKTTCIMGMCRLADGKLTTSINVRYAIQADQCLQRKKLIDACETAGFTVENLSDSAPRYMSAEEEPAAGLLQLYREMTGDMSQPIIMGGGTHARKFPNALPYGPGHWGFSGKFGGAHEVDEAVYLEHLTQALPIYVAALMQLDQYFQREAPTMEE